MNITFDNNVLLSATLWDGSVAQKLMFDVIRRGDVKICASQEILDDYRKILERDFGFNNNEISKIMKTVLAAVTLIVVQKHVKAVPDDPDDDIIVSCALASNSKYLITYDSHLLKIVEYKGIKIVTPEAARAII